MSWTHSGLADLATIGLLMWQSGCASAPPALVAAPASPPGPASVEKVSCTSTQRLCNAAVAYIADEKAGSLPQLDAIELGLSCGDERARRCTLDAAVELMGRSWQGDWSASIGARAQRKLVGACSAGFVAACDALMEHQSHAPAWRLSASLEVFTVACKSGQSMACSRLIDLCNKDACEIAAARTALSAGCRDNLCFDGAGRILEKKGDLSAARSLYEEGCLKGNSSACASGGALTRGESAEARAAHEQALRKRCGDSARCGVLAAQLLGAAANPSGARDFLEKSCAGGELDACERLPWVLLQLPKPDSERGIAAFDERCHQKKEKQSCYLLARLYRDGDIVKADKAKSAGYAKVACDQGEAMACDWGRVSTSSGPERSIFEQILSGLLSPLRALP